MSCFFSVVLSFSVLCFFLFICCLFFVFFCFGFLVCVSFCFYVVVMSLFRGVYGSFRMKIKLISMDCDNVASVTFGSSPFAKLLSRDAIGDVTLASCSSPPRNSLSYDLPFSLRVSG